MRVAALVQDVLLVELGEHCERVLLWPRGNVVRLRPLPVRAVAALEEPPERFDNGLAERLHEHACRDVVRLTADRGDRNAHTDRAGTVPSGYIQCPRCGAIRELRGAGASVLA